MNSRCISSEKEQNALKQSLSQSGWNLGLLGLFCFAKKTNCDGNKEIRVTNENLVMFSAIDGRHRCLVLKVFFFFFSMFFQECKKGECFLLGGGCCCDLVFFVLWVLGFGFVFMDIFL